MAMNKEVAQVRLTREVRDAETALNEALLRQSQLMSTMLAARRDTGTGAFTGQDALMRLTRSQQALVSAGSDLARVHGRLAEIGHEVGALDDIFCPPEHGPMGSLSEAA